MLLILAGLLWPLLFDFDERLSLEAPASQIPPMPVSSMPEAGSTDTRPVAVPKKVVASPADDKPEKVADLQSLPEPAPPAGKKRYSNQVASDDRPRLDAEGIPVSFVVQVGTFSQWQNADRLRKQLVDKGHKAYTRPAVSTAPGPYKVMVGPLLTIARANAVAAEVKTRFKVNDAMVLRFSAKS